MQETNWNNSIECLIHSKINNRYSVFYLLILSIPKITWYQWTKYQWNDTHRGKCNTLEKNLPQCHCVPHKSYKLPWHWTQASAVTDPWCVQVKVMKISNKAPPSHVMVVVSICCFSTFQVRLQLWRMAATLLHTVHIQVVLWWDTLFSMSYVDTVIILIAILLSQIHTRILL